MSGWSGQISDWHANPSEQCRIGIDFCSRQSMYYPSDCFGIERCYVACIARRILWTNTEIDILNNGTDFDIAVLTNCGTFRRDGAR